MGGRMNLLPPTIKQIPAAVAKKLDDSNRIVWNWRDLWHARSVQLNALGAFLSFLIGTALWIAPLLGVIWAASSTVKGFISANNVTITLDGTTKGGVLGDTYQFVDMKANKWMVQGFTSPTGSIATPFS